MTSFPISRLAVALLASVATGCVPERLPPRNDTAGGIRHLEASPLSTAELKTLATSNQLIFVKTKKGLEPVCRCGPKIRYSEISPFVIDALVATEDHRFFLHKGVDPYAMLRAISRYVASGFKSLEGGSTITQQLVKNTILSSDRSINRKIEEQGLAEMLETVMGKKEILVAYLNQMIFGYDNGLPIVGIEQAARVYFGRSAADLDLLQSAILVGMLKSPAAYSPSEHSSAARARAKIVLTAMVRAGRISRKTADSALASERPTGKLKPILAETRNFTQWVLNDIASLNSGFEPSPSTHIPLTLQVVTQKNAETALSQALAARQGTAEVEAAYTVMTLDGKVLAMVGQRDFAVRNLNFTTQTKRPPASSFKPIVFTAAFEAGLLKVTVETRHLTAISWNAFAEEIFAKVGVERVVAMAARLGIKSRLREDNNLALGGSEVTLLDMVSAYQTIANDGLSATPSGFYGITDGGEKRHWNRYYSHRVISAAVASKTKELLRAVVENPEGTGHSANVISGAFGKTGTSDDNRDAWFIGSTGRRVSGLWIGRPDNAPMSGSIHGASAAGIWTIIETSLTTRPEGGT